MLKKIIYAVLIVLSVYGCYSISSQNEASNELPAYPMLTQKQMEEDLDLLVKELEQKHAGLYRYQPQLSWKKHVKLCRKNLQNPHNLLEFHKTINRLVRPIRCGHTRVKLPDEFVEKYQQNKLFFPLQLKFIEGKALVVKDLSMHPKLKKGDQILSINGQNLDKIISKIQQYTSGLADGFNQTGQLRVIEQHFASFYAVFLDDSEEFELSFRPYKAQKLKKIQIKGIKLIQNEVTNPQANIPLKLDLIDDLKLGILKLSSFDPQIFEKYNMDFPSSIRAVFQKLHQAQSTHLILDLRGNTGGDLLHLLGFLSYVIDEPFQVFEKIEANPNQKDSLQPQKPFKIPSGSVNFIFKMQTIPHTLCFRGQIVVLTDGLTFSAGSVAAALIKSHQSGILLGEESGGAYLGNNSGILSSIKLPNSSITVRIPMWYYANAVRKIPQSSSGVIPDFAIQQNTQDFQEDVDTVMKAAIAMIRKKKDIRLSLPLHKRS